MIQEFLNYQKLDGELIRLEKELDNNENKKQANLMIKFVKDATEKTKQLDNEANKLVEELKKLEEVEKKGISHVEKLMKQDINALSEEELADLEHKISSASRNLKELEKRLRAQTDRINEALKEFENTKKKIYIARQKHKENKDSYDVYLKEAEPKINSLKQQLKQMEKSLDKELFEKYKELRKDGMFPIMVPLLEEKVCGGCRTNLPSSTIERIKQHGTIRCENCRRIIFTK